jgi:hypothetical protein
MPAAFPPMPSRGLPVRAVKFNSRSPSTGPRGIEPSGEYAVAGPAAAGQRASIGGKAEEKRLTGKDIKHRPAGSFRSGCHQTRPRREHGGSFSPWLKITPLDTGEHVRERGFDPPGGPQDVSLICRRRGRGLAVLNLRWGIVDSHSPLASSEGNTKVCLGCSRRPVRPAQKNVSVSP